MNDWNAQTRLLVLARIRERELEAASERLAASARVSSNPNSLRRSLGRLLILTGLLVAGESVPTGSPAVRPARPITA